jgi:chromosomal replication initiation ATPase DnaA
MNIIEVNLTKDTAQTVGLQQICMKKMGNTILLAGKNGSGKTRLLNIIRQQATKLPGNARVLSVNSFASHSFIPLTSK